MRKTRKWPNMFGSKRKHDKQRRDLRTAIKFDRWVRYYCPDQSKFALLTNTD